MGPPLTRVDTTRKLVALTFDDGPGPHTQAILDALKGKRANGAPARPVQATFFVVGTHARAYPRLVKKAHAAGHSIANHTDTHPFLTRKGASEVRTELMKTSRALNQATGLVPQLFRPPYMDYNASVTAEATALGMRTILWDVDTRDWARPGTAAIVNTAVSQAKAGSIVLMHDAGGPRQQTVEALPQIIDQLHAKGFKFVTVPQLIAAAARP